MYSLRKGFPLRVVSDSPFKSVSHRQINVYSNRALIDRVFAVFPAPETIHSDQGSDLEYELIRELQSVIGFRKTRTLPYRPQGNSILERVHSTMLNMLATLANTSCDNWVELLPFAQLAHNTTRLRISSCLAGEPHCPLTSFSSFPLIPRPNCVKICSPVPLRIFS